MKHRNSHLLVGYWDRLRKGRDVPDQTDIDPRAIKRLLSYTFILDCALPSRPVYRLAGTALCERFGFELKGTGFLAHWESRSSLALAPLLNQALTVTQSAPAPSQRRETSSRVRAPQRTASTTSRSEIPRQMQRIIGSVSLSRT